MKRCFFKTLLPLAVLSTSTQAIVMEENTTTPLAPKYLKDYYNNGTMVALKFFDYANNESGFKIYTDAGELVKELPARRGKGYVFTSLKNLEPATDYTLSVVSYNDAGESNASNTIQFSTKEVKTEVPKSISKLKTLKVSQKFATLLFLDNALNEEGFKIYNNKEVLKTVHKRRGKGFVYTRLTGLEPGTDYNLSVVAYNDFGEANSSESVSFKTNSTPIAKLMKPTRLGSYNVDKTTATLHFLDYGYNEKGFKIYTNDGVLLKTIPAHNGTGFVTATLDKLTANTHYSIYAVSYNEQGESDKSKAISFTTKEESTAVPTAPKYFNNYYSMSNNKIALRFFDYSEDEEGFKIYTTDDVLIKTLPKHNKKGYVNTTLTDLNASTEYNLYVVSYNEVGESAQSNIVSFETEAAADAVPSAPTKLMLYPLGQTAVRAVFYDNSTTEKGFKVYTADGKLLKDIPSYYAKSKRYVSSFIMNLEKDTEYTLYVVAYNEAGESKATDTQTVKTRK